MELRSVGVRNHGLLINNNGQALVSSEAISEGSFASNEGRAFATPTPVLDVGITEGSALWIKYTGKKLFSIGSLFLGWNGGNVTKQATAFFKFYIGSSEPVDDAARNVSGFGNLLLGSVESLDSTVYFGSGMTVAELGQFAGAAIITKGEVLKPFEGLITMSPNQVLNFTFEGEEAGKATFYFTGWEAPERDV